ncbi:outer membrane protein [Taklimakanibacter deserti]|uniref:outer membrane protein n=1 Tax=Taklimakanibacter deserti TaxID=2267839 RepID=UPI000E657232
MIKKVLLSGAAVVLMSAGAQAADIIEPPTVYDWTGPYIGLQGGYAWGENDASADENVIVPLSDDVTLNGDEGSIDIDGFVGGAHAGFNWQADSLVLGLEGDIEYADMDGNTDVVDGLGFKVGEITQEIDWLGSLRLRAGFAADRALFYATGGLAVGGVKLALEDGGGDEFADEKKTKWGWTVGGGIEYAFTDDFSARIEYRYTDLGKIEAGDADEGGDGEVDTAFHAVRAGLSWHFGGL